MTDDKTKESVAEPGQSDPASGASANSNVAPFAATGRGKPCPICGRPSIVEMRPFCSKRCADIDLGKWFGEAYRIPSVEPPSSDEGDSPPSRPASKDDSQTP